MGEIGIIKAYLVEEFCSECEGEEFLLIDKTSGETQHMPAYPHVSILNKTVLCVIDVLDNSGEDHARLELYHYRQDKIVLIARKEFRNWRHVHSNMGFWSNNGYFYTAVLDAMSFNPNKPESDYKYIKIKMPAK